MELLVNSIGGEAPIIQGDFVRVRIPVDHHPFHLQHKVTMDSKTNKPVEGAPIKPMLNEAKGSASTVTKVWSEGRLGNGMYQTLVIDGNQTKWFQKQNVYASTDVVGMIRAYIRAVALEVANLILLDEEIDNAMLYRVDFNAAIETYDRRTAQIAIGRLKEFAVWGRHKASSKRWDNYVRFETKSKNNTKSFKFYLKAMEFDREIIEKNPLSTRGRKDAEFIEADQATKLRAELRLDAKGLDLWNKRVQKTRSSRLPPINVRRLGDLTNELIQEMFMEQFSQFQIQQPPSQVDEILQHIKPHLASCFQMWAYGRNVKEIYKSQGIHEQTWYKHLREMKQNYGIDISNPPNPETVKKLHAVDPSQWTWVSERPEEIEHLVVEPQKQQVFVFQVTAK